MNKKGLIDDWFDFIFTVVMAILLFIFLNFFTSTTAHQESAQVNEKEILVENDLINLLQTSLSPGYNSLWKEEQNFFIKCDACIEGLTANEQEIKTDSYLAPQIEKKKIVQDLIAENAPSWPGALALLWQTKMLVGEKFLLVVEYPQGRLMIQHPGTSHFSAFSGDNPIGELDKAVRATAYAISPDKQLIKIHLFYFKE